MRDTKASHVVRVGQHCSLWSKRVRLCFRGASPPAVWPPPGCFLTPPPESLPPPRALPLPTPAVSADRRGQGLCPRMQKWFFEKFGEYVEDFRFQPEESAVETEEPLSARRWGPREPGRCSAEPRSGVRPGTRPQSRAPTARASPWGHTPTVGPWSLWAPDGPGPHTPSLWVLRSVAGTRAGSMGKVPSSRPRPAGVRAQVRGAGGVRAQVRSAGAHPLSPRLPD